MSILREIYDRLIDFYGAEPAKNWWPEDPFEVIVGAVLVPGANWKVVAKVLGELKADELLDFAKLRAMEVAELAGRIRSVGFQQRKAGALHGILEQIDLVSNGDLGRYFARDLETIRKELLAIKGIGASVADNILLYAGKFPIYMVDPFTTRIFIRHGLIREKAKDEEVQRLIHHELTHDAEPYGADLFNSFQSLLVRIGRDYCDKSRPSCPACPLRPLLPETGIVLPAPAPRKSKSARSSDRRIDVSIPSVSAAVQAPPVSTIRALDELSLSEQERIVMERISHEITPIDSIIQSTDLAAHVVQSVLMGLEFQRLVRRCEGNAVIRLQ